MRAIGKLPKNRFYNYIYSRNSGQIEIVSVTEPEGPIIVKRYNPNKGETRADAQDESISTQMLWRVANALRPEAPINVDRVLGGSYNTRSVLEALLAHTPEFYYAYPGRIEAISSSTEIKRGHKHLIWRPNDPHEPNVMQEAKTEIVISEIPTAETVYESLIIPEPNTDLDINIQRRHAQIQIALVMIGQQLNFRTWIAQNDKGIIYHNQRIGEMESVIVSLRDEKLLTAYDQAIKAALLIDCIWFRNTRFMPAVFEIEHSTGVTSGLTRMKGLFDTMPPIPTRWAIVAADNEREKVMREANRPQFKAMNPMFFPYSAVEELYSLCQRRGLRGVNDEFLDCFMEPCIEK